MIMSDLFVFFFFFFNDTATTEIYTLSLHDALPILSVLRAVVAHSANRLAHQFVIIHVRSEEHTSELQSRLHLVCRLLLEKKTPRPLDEHRIDLVLRTVCSPAVLAFTC